MNRWTTGIRIPILILILGLSGCGSSESGVGGRPSSGSAASSGAKPECGALNQACLEQGLNAPLALGSSMEFSIEFSVAGSSSPPIHLETTNQDVLTAQGTTLSAVGEGSSGVLFASAEGLILDFIYVWVAAAQELRIMRYSPQGTLLGRVQSDITLMVGDELLVSVEPFANSQVLLGNFQMERTLEGDCLTILPDPVGGWYRIVARSEGMAVLTFSGVGLSQELNIEVVP